MSTASVRQYETVYILQPSISENVESTIHQKIDSVISKFKGKLSLRDEWGLKEMAYSINDYKNGKYVIINYSGTPGVVAEIERHFKILDDVIRFSTVRLEDDYEYNKVKKQIGHAEEESKRIREARMKRY